MPHFVAYTMPRYQFNWHHKAIIRKLEAFTRKEITRLIITCPPRHGKSQLVSRHLPAWIFGQNPDARIIACSYSASLASDMNTDTQRIMTSEEYVDLFPKASLNPKNVVTLTQPKRNSERFDIVGANGHYICAGVGGPITGKGADYAIIDDPIKNKEEAFSPVFRERLWQWYASTLYTRLEEQGAILLTLTRWHEDDLAGRLLKQMKEDPDADQWEVVNFPAIKEDDTNPDDPREIGEALWPGKYDLEALTKIRTNVQSHWFPLYQQRPSAEAGNIIKKDWFQTYEPHTVRLGPVNFYLDTAYTDNKKNDRTAVITYAKSGRNLYIVDCRAVWKDFPELIRFLKGHFAQMGYTGASRIYIEPKASGKSVVQQLKAETGLNVIEDKPPTEAKEVRVRSITPIIEAGRVLIPEGALWADAFLDECASFPNAAHDDMVDALVGAINKSLRTSGIQMSGSDYDEY